jgi:hypothetical protein
MLALVHGFEGPPSLGGAYGDWRVHAVTAAVMADEPVEPLPAADEDLPLRHAIDVGRFQRQHRVGTTGVIVYVASLGVATMGELVFVIGALGIAVGDDSGASAGYVVGGAGLVVVGAVGAVTGEVMLFAGGIGASHTLGLPTGVGWGGVALAIGSVVVGIVPSSATIYLSGAMNLGALACGAVQLGASGREGRYQGYLTELHVVPTGDGLAVTGRF